MKKSQTELQKDNAAKTYEGTQAKTIDKLCDDYLSKKSVFENAKEVTTRRDLKLELFIHKFLLHMPREDFADFYIRADEVGLDETSILYTNGIVKQKFRPYSIPRRG